MKFTKETLRKTIRTFIQAFLPALAVGIGTISWGDDGSVTKGAIISLVIPAVAAGLCAVMNLENPNKDIEEGGDDDDVPSVG